MKFLHFLTLTAPLVIFSACSKSGNSSDTNAINEFPVTTVIRKDTVLFHEYVVDVHAIKNVEIRARVQGYLDYIYVDEGQSVKAGQLLFKINDEEYVAEVAKAKASVNSAIAEEQAMQLESERVSILVEKNVVTQTELRLAKAKVDMAKAKVEEAKSQLLQANIRYAHTSIKAPFDGVVDRLPFKIGSLINEGHLLTTLFDSRFVYAYFRVSEKEYLEYLKSHPDDRRSSNVELIQADGNLHQQPGKIETLEGEFDTSTGTIAFRAKFPNPQLILKHGSSGKVRLSNHIENALLIPQKATFEIQDKTYVFLVDADNKIKVKSFVPRARLSHFYIVESMSFP
ncbi:MAG: efflux RND transporter periplasmic adaptor subunit [Cyclobacteriaceae bacterium]|nr:efflux RND transporter periplasmic adaptor subunit [Cyclobacteriaceae bacterium]